MGDVVHTRREDSGLGKWLPVLVPVLAIGIAWGEQKVARERNTDAIALNTSVAKELTTEVRRLSDQSIRYEITVSSMQDRLAEATVTSEIVAKLAADVGKLQATIEQEIRMRSNQWPIVRRNQAYREEMTGKKDP